MKPKYIMVKGQRYKIKYIKNLKSDDGCPLFGQCLKDDKIILIEASLEGEMLKRTLTHEACHSVIAECHVDEFMSGSLEESIVRCFEDFFWDKIDF